MNNTSGQKQNSNTVAQKCRQDLKFNESIAESSIGTNSKIKNINALKNAKNPFTQPTTLGPTPETITNNGPFQNSAKNLK